MAKPGLEAKQLASWRDGKAAAWSRAGLRIGLFGGSFNPAHGGHRHVALSALNALKLDAVIWLVAPQNPLKSSQDMAEYDRRLMSTRKIAEHPRMVVSDNENRLGHFFTADSLRWWTKRYPTAKFVWLMGADSFMNIHRWKYWRGIMEAVPVAIVPRPGSSLASIRAKVARQMDWARVPTSRVNRLFNHHPPAWMMLAAELDKRSASAIRARGEWP